MGKTHKKYRERLNPSHNLRKKQKQRKQILNKFNNLDLREVDLTELEGEFYSDEQSRNE